MRINSINYLWAILFIFGIVCFHNFVFVSIPAVVLFLSLFLFNFNFRNFRIVFEDRVLNIIILFLAGITYWAFRIEPFEFDYLNYVTSLKSSNILWGYCFALLSFFIGITYDYMKYRLKIFSVVTTLYLVIFSARVLMSISEFRNGNNLWPEYFFSPCCQYPHW